MAIFQGKIVLSSRSTHQLLMDHQLEMRSPENLHHLCWIFVGLDLLQGMWRKPKMLQVLLGNSKIIFIRQQYTILIPSSSSYIISAPSSGCHLGFGDKLWTQEDIFLKVSLDLHSYLILGGRTKCLSFLTATISMSLSFCYLKEQWLELLESNMFKKHFGT